MSHQYPPQQPRHTNLPLPNTSQLNSLRPSPHTVNSANYNNNTTSTNININGNTSTQYNSAQLSSIFRSPELPQSAHDAIVRHMIDNKHIPINTPMWDESYNKYVKQWYIDSQRNANNNTQKTINQTNNSNMYRQSPHTNPNVMPQSQPPVPVPVPVPQSRINTSALPLPTNPQALQPNNNNSNYNHSSGAPSRSVTPPTHPVSTNEMIDVTRILAACARHQLSQLQTDKKIEINQFLSILKSNSSSMSTLQKQIMTGGNTPHEHQLKLRQLYTYAKQRQQQQEHKLQQAQQTVTNGTAQPASTTPVQPINNNNTDHVDLTSTPSDSTTPLKLIDNTINTTKSESPQNDDGNISFLQSQSIEASNTTPTAEQQQQSNELDLPVEQSGHLLNDFNDTQILLDNNAINKKIEPRTIIKLKPQDEELQKWLHTQYEQYQQLYWFIDIKQCMDIIRYTCHQYSLQCYNTELYEIMSIVTQMYIKQVIEKLIYWCKQRYDIFTDQLCDTNDILYNPKQLIQDYERQQLYQPSAINNDTAMKTGDSTTTDITNTQSTPSQQQFDDTFHTTQATLEGIGSTLTSFKKQKTSHDTSAGAVSNTNTFISPLNALFTTNNNKRSLLSRLKGTRQFNLINTNKSDKSNKQHTHQSYNINILDMLTYMNTNRLLCRSHRLYETYLELAPKPIEKLLASDNDK